MCPKHRHTATQQCSVGAAATVVGRCGQSRRCAHAAVVIASSIGANQRTPQEKESEKTHTRIKQYTKAHTQARTHTHIRTYRQILLPFGAFRRNCPHPRPNPFSLCASLLCAPKSPIDSFCWAVRVAHSQESNSCLARSRDSLAPGSRLPASLKPR